MPKRHKCRPSDRENGEEEEAEEEEKEEEEEEETPIPSVGLQALGRRVPLQYSQEKATQKPQPRGPPLAFWLCSAWTYISRERKSARRPRPPAALEGLVGLQARMKGSVTILLRRQPHEHLSRGVPPWRFGIAACGPTSPRSGSRHDIPSHQPHKKEEERRRKRKRTYQN